MASKRITLRELKSLVKEIIKEEKGESFIPHGYYTISNTMGYEVMLSNDGEAAKLRDHNGKVTDWLEIEFVDDKETLDSNPVIDPNGYDIPLNMVMRTKI